ACIDASKTSEGRGVYPKVFGFGFGLINLRQEMGPMGVISRFAGIRCPAPLLCTVALRCSGATL
ncbi:MAG: hypothetical protein VX739_03325, partial [Planctomycetota bacterium]|nr:hypothetical protein [Planctomycetota bacterium]